MFSKDKNNSGLTSPVTLFSIPDPTIKDISSVQEDTQFKIKIDTSGNVTDEIFFKEFEKNDIIIFDNIEFYK